MQATTSFKVYNLTYQNIFLHVVGFIIIVPYYNCSIYNNVIYTTIWVLSEIVDILLLFRL